MSGEKIKVKNEAGFYEMRFESIGGVGAEPARENAAEADIIREGPERP